MRELQFFAATANIYNPCHETTTLSRHIQETPSFVYVSLDVQIHKTSPNWTTANTRVLCLLLSQLGSSECTAEKVLSILQVTLLYFEQLRYTLLNSSVDIAHLTVVLKTESTLNPIHLAGETRLRNLFPHSRPSALCSRLLICINLHKYRYVILVVCLYESFDILQYYYL